MRVLKTLFANNERWAKRITEADPEFFSTLSRQQNPQYLWIGCSDSRVPATEIVDLLPGEIFVHRNIANLVIHTDMNCLSVIQYAVEVLEVKHAIVCGHYGCGGVKAAMDDARHGLIDNWLEKIRELYHLHRAEVDGLTDPRRRLDRLCELNVISQVISLCRTTVVMAAWERGQELAVHGWIYGIDNGRLRDLDVCVTSSEEARRLAHR